MLPGAGGMKQQLENFDEREIVRTEAIIQSMTLAERRNPKLLNGSRRLRIARGSGMTVTDVNQLVQRFEQAAKMMKTVARGGMPQIPGMGPIPGGGGYGGGKRQAAKGKKKASGSRSGNPAKRAAENAAIASGVAPAGQGSAPAGSGFGLGRRRREAGAERRGARGHAEVPRPVALGAVVTRRAASRASISSDRSISSACAVAMARAHRATAGSPDSASRSSAISSGAPVVGDHRRRRRADRTRLRRVPPRGRWSTG